MQIGTVEMYLGLAASVLALGGAALALWRRVFSKIHLSYAYSWGRDVSHALREAKDRVWILQTWVPDLQVSVDDWRYVLQRSPRVSFRVLLLAPELVPYRLRGRFDERITGQTDFNVKQIQSLRVEFNTTPNYPRIQAKFYSLLPFGPVYILDNWVYWGIYTAHQDSLKLPAFRHHVTSRFGSAILASFERVWEGGSESSGEDTLDLSAAKVDEGPPQPSAESTGVQVELEAAIDRLGGTLRPLTNPHEAGLHGTLVLVRTGVTDLEAAGLIAGQLDIGLNTEGRRQARALREALRRFSANPLVWSSPLRRARECVSVALPGIDASIETVDQLRDRSMGRLEGVRWPVEGPAYSEYDGLQIFTKPDESAESLADVALRLAPILQQAADSVREGKTVVLFTHGVIVAAAAFLLGSRPESGPIGFGEAWFYTDRYESSKAAVT